MHIKALHFQADGISPRFFFSFFILLFIRRRAESLLITPRCSMTALRNERGKARCQRVSDNATLAGLLLIPHQKSRQQSNKVRFTKPVQFKVHEIITFSPSTSCTHSTLPTAERRSGSVIRTATFRVCRTTRQHSGALMAQKSALILALNCTLSNKGNL